LFSRLKKNKKWEILFENKLEATTLSEEQLEKLANSDL
jgi:hypothetical protein